MSEFDPARPSIVHDRQSGRTLAWLPQWEKIYRQYSRILSDGAIEFHVLVLDGWRECHHDWLPEDVPD
jgi:hypothetical protein